MLRLKDDGSTGHCFGMVYSAIASYLGFPNISSYKKNYKTLNDVAGNASSNQLMCSAYEYIDYAFVYQFSSKIQIKEKNNINDYNGVYNAVKDFQNNNDKPVAISFGINNNIGHTVLGIKISKETSDYTEILVYDCNHPNEKNYLTLRGRVGNFTGWSYPWGENKTWQNGGSSYLTYSTCGEEFIHDFQNTYTLFKDDLVIMALKDEIRKLGSLFLNGQSVSLDDLDSKSRNDIIPIRTKTEPTNVSSVKEYWLDGDGSNILFNSLGKNEEIILAKNDIGISTQMSSEGNINIDLDKKNIKLEGSDNSSIKIGIKTENKDYTINETVISGDIGGAANIHKKNDGGIIISGIKKCTVVHGNKNLDDENISNSVEAKIDNLDENLEYEIKENLDETGNSIVISKDSNGDGIFDETIASAKKTFIVKLNTSKIVLKKKQSTSNVKVVNLPVGDKIKSWKSSNLKIVKVSNKGKITAQNKTGSATITVTTVNGATATLKIKVQNGTVKTAKISGLPKKLSIAKGEKYTLKPQITPITSQQKVTYSSSKKKIANISGKGVITGKKKGKTKIAVKSGSKKHVVTVIVS